jgi:hypothetical protein
LGRNLQVLDLEGCEGVSNQGLLSLFLACHRLQRLVLNGLPRVDDVAVQALLPRRNRHLRLPCLVDLNLNVCRGVSLHTVQELKRQRPDILRVTYRREVALRGPTSF